MYNIPRKDDTSKRVNYTPSNSYQRVPLTIVENGATRARGNVPEQVHITSTYDVGNNEEEVHPDPKLVKIFLCRSIYSAGTLRCAYLYAVFATFMSQVFLLYLFFSEEGQQFNSKIGYVGDTRHHVVFKRALGRFICFVVILMKG